MSRRQLDRTGGAAALGGVAADDTGCTVLHVDMDAFYASVELHRPARAARAARSSSAAGAAGEWCSRPPTRRAAFGVHSAMPMARARRLCPQARRRASPTTRATARSPRGVMEIFRSITPAGRAALPRRGLPRRRRRGAPARQPATIAQPDPRPGRRRAAHHLLGRGGRHQVRRQARVRPGQARRPARRPARRDRRRSCTRCRVGALWGVGERTEEVARPARPAHRRRHRPHPARHAASARSGEATGAHLHDLAWGRDPRTVVRRARERSVGAEETFARDVDDPDVILRELLRLSRAGRRPAACRRAPSGRTVVLKVRFADFTTITRSRTLREPTDVARTSTPPPGTCSTRSGWTGPGCGWSGVRVEGLVAAVHRRTGSWLLDERPQGWREAERAVDRASARFGAGVVRPATLVPDASSDDSPARRSVPCHPGTALAPRSRLKVTSSNRSGVSRLC